jgi:hypothetical protein
MSASARKTIMIDLATYTKLQEYSKITGVPLAVATTKALNDWLDNVAPAHIEAMCGREVAAQALHA